ncbi:glycosyltransferase [Novosphingobium sp. FSY-8]|uniref:Glycosyltransferase n=1 Tax=Novosphingobium ovatum TaxID=1908523 RepID=A0ABW9XEC6_9SPHN|nr:glycosyltransferase [Novosphingobium ovatum]NBC36895.1 glycosyltransferase [Novosphingobium ovatum]
MGKADGAGVMPRAQAQDVARLRDSGLFDAAWYAARYPDVAASGMDPLEHYVWLGWRLQRAPGPGAGVSAPDLVAERAGLIGANDAGADGAGVPQGDWPPPPLGDFWLPQVLRDVIISGYGEGVAPLYWYLCSVMARWVDEPDGFAGSGDAARLVARLQALAARGDAPPDVSVIVPVYNHVLDTMLCLVSVLEHAGNRAVEVIVADDGSSDATARLVGAIGGCVRHVRQAENLGFLGNCNAAAGSARGAHIVLLNNDTLVLPGWLEALLAPFDADWRGIPVGLVGAKLLNWDGSLQEAGGIYWNDGSAWNYGRGQDARAPQFNYVKEADYCSGAAIAIPNALWHALEGFDRHFLPAYCEDADLAFRVRAAGYATLYQPAAEVIHHEGRSHGRDTGQGIKAHQITNQAKLRDRWADDLAREHYPNAVNVWRARDRTGARPHVLVVDHYVPQWDRDAGSRSTFDCIQTLIQMGVQVTFWPDNLHADPAYCPRLQAMGVEVMYGPALAGGFARFMAERADLYDAVLLNRPHIAGAYYDAIRGESGARVAYYGHDLHHLRMQRHLDTTGEGSAQAIARMRRIERDVCLRADCVLFPDPNEVAAVARDLGGGRDYLTLPVVCHDGTAGAARLAGDGCDRGAELLFVGGFAHPPNRDGLLWFVTHVMPLLRGRVPGVRLTVVGSNAPADVLALDGGDIRVLGQVSDDALAAAYDAAAVAVAPLRFGAGVKGKVVEAMARGVPVVTTSIGAQGIAQADQALFVADAAEGFADGVAAALRDGAARAQAALNVVRRDFSRDAMAAVLARALGI